MVFRERWRLLLGSLGLGLALLGVLLFVGQTLRSMEKGRFEITPVRAVFQEPMVREHVPSSLGQWFRTLSDFDVENAVNWFLDEVPLSLLLIALGGAMAWWNLSRSTEPLKR